VLENNAPGSSSPLTTPVDTTPLCDGRFVPFRRLGIGSQGETFEAVDRLTGKAVALKRFDVQGAHNWKDVELAEREALVLKTLHHPALPAYVLHFEQGGALYLAMEKIDGKSLATATLEGKRFSLDELFRLLETLADVFAYLHGQHPPIVHRDIKPSNLILKEDGQFALIDFGSVRNGLLPQGGSTVVGTFGYMAPEQFQGRAMPASDLYGTGVTLLALLTGISPEQLPHRGLQLDVRKALPSSTPEPWLNLIERLTSIDPDSRNVDLSQLVPSLRGVNAPPPRTTKDHNAASNSSTSRGASEPPRATVSEASRGAPVVEYGSFPFFLPFPIIMILRILRILLHIGLVVALPLLLTLLSIVFGRSLRSAAKEVSEAGETAIRELTRLIPPHPQFRAEKYRQPYYQNRRNRPRVRVIDVDVDVDNEQNPADDVERHRRRS
jgi:serine/threonine protein kinase